MIRATREKLERCATAEAKLARIEALCDASTRAAEEEQAAYYERTGYRNMMIPLLDVTEVRAILRGAA